ncbi:IS110 family transposase [Xenorhabdus sp. Sc-CR9]|uniref:IS110 family transposase n=1 Tax=Xenorhabdus sp. Sc-CR9 TaxID=2584468 RepID=UPI001EFF943C|nr:transposase [Xenorhabdus sp. Sc-CR9]
MILSALFPTQHKALCKNQKNDANDALAICETACRPEIHCVPVKTIEQQDIKALRSVRQLMVEQCTALVNQIRALLAEQGIVIPAGIQQLRQAMPDILEEGDNPLPRNADFLAICDCFIRIYFSDHPPVIPSLKHIR